MFIHEQAVKRRALCEVCTIIVFILICCFQIQICQQCRNLLIDAGHNIHYLEDELCAAEPFGLRIYGSPWQPEFCDWAFNESRGEPLRRRWAQIPSDIDILMTHGPPAGVRSYV